jgi:hypothetical protein
VEITLPFTGVVAKQQLPPAREPQLA